MNGIYLGLGTNMGDRQQQLQTALSLIRQHIGDIVKQSSVIETKAWGNTDQADFLNMAVKVDTSLSPRKLLTACQHIERSMGRIKEVKWGPRIIDIDILYYNDLAIQDEDLVVPHPYIQERDFVLIPLSEIT